MEVSWLKTCATSPPPPADKCLSRSVVWTPSPLPPSPQLSPKTLFAAAQRNPLYPLQLSRTSMFLQIVCTRSLAFWFFFCFNDTLSNSIILQNVTCHFITIIGIESTRCSLTIITLSVWYSLVVATGSFLVARMPMVIPASFDWLQRMSIYIDFELMNSIERFRMSGWLVRRLFPSLLQTV